jgi:HlyD family secretion protein
MTSATGSSSETAGNPERKKRLNPLLFIPVGLGVVAIGAGVWYWLSRPDANTIELSGRLEGYETDIGTKVPGRVEEVTVREGDSVDIGDLLVQLDDAELQAQLAGAIAAVNTAIQNETNARLQVAVIENQITEAQLNLEQAQGDSQGRIDQAEANLATANAQLRQAEAQAVQAQAELDLARLNRDRFAQLVQEGAVTQEQFDQAQTNFETAQATLASREAAINAAQRQVNAAQGQLTQSRSSGFNPDIRTAQLNRLATQLEQARAQLAAAQAQVANAEASRDRIQAQLDDLTINSPIDGVVTVRSIEPGTVVAAGRNLLTVLDLDTVYLRGFVPEGDIGRIRVGQEARVYLDSNPDQPLEGRVAAIDSQASFTPENIYFQEDRVQQVFGLRITLENPDGFAKPGMPADAEILVEGEE